MKKDAHYFMTKAFTQACRAAARSEVPVGAVVVAGERIIGRGQNRMIASSDPTAHAEIVALRQAARKSGNYRLPGADLYVSLEPCLMCYSAMVQARIGTLHYAAADPKTGVFSTGVFSQARHVFNHAIAVQTGDMEPESSQLLRTFFKARRGAGAVERDGLENRCRG
jgi:tRNA(adenine34) deaminase